MAWLRRAVTVDVAASPGEVAQRVMAAVARGTRPRLYGHANPFGVDLHTQWRPALLRQHYPIAIAGTLTPTPTGTRAEAMVTVGFAVQFMLAGAAGVAALAIWAGLAHVWSPFTAALVLAVATGHLYSVDANLRDGERSFRQALSGPPPAPGASVS